eukprot:1500949-Rhodomonas_salina.1
MDWRSFRAKLVKSEQQAQAQNDVAEAGRGEAVQEDDELWLHELAVPEPGCLLIANPSKFQTSQVLIHNDFGAKLRRCQCKMSRMAGQSARTDDNQTLVPELFQTRCDFAGRAWRGGLRRFHPQPPNPVGGRRYRSDAFCLR